MVWTVLGLVLTPGLGAALSPLVIVAATILATAKGGARKTFIFAFGAFLAMAIVGVGATLAADGADAVMDDSGPSKLKLIVRLLVGLLLWFMAWRTFKNRPADGESPAIMTKLNALDQYPPLKILTLGVALGLLNAKNLPLAISVGVAVSQSGADTMLAIIGMLVFAALSTVAVIIPGVIALTRPNEAERLLGGVRNFFVDHNTAIMVALYVLLGASMVGDSIGPLFN